MRKFIFAILFSIFFIGCASTSISPIEEKPKIDDENLKLEAYMKTYAGYPELVKRGFDIHSLDYIKSKEEFVNALKPYFYDYEDGTAFDNHFGVYSSIQDELSTCYRPVFTDEYGTKDELLKKGYVENETMFYYPSNGEKDWRVGKRISNHLIQSPGNDHLSGWLVPGTLYLNPKSYGFVEKDDFILLRIAEHPRNPNSYSDFFKKAKKKNIIIIDLTWDMGGCADDALSFLRGFKSLKDKKVIVLAGGGTRSCGEYLLANLKTYPNVTVIGGSSIGATRYSVDLTDFHDFPKLGIMKFTVSHHISGSILELGKNVKHLLKEGIGISPDYWVSTEEDCIKCINLVAGYELFPVEKNVLFNLMLFKK